MRRACRGKSSPQARCRRYSNATLPPRLWPMTMFGARPPNCERNSWATSVAEAPRVCGGRNPSTWLLSPWHLWSTSTTRHALRRLHQDSWHVQVVLHPGQVQIHSPAAQPACSCRPPTSVDMRQLNIWHAVELAPERSLYRQNSDCHEAVQQIRQECVHFPYFFASGSACQSFRSQVPQLRPSRNPVRLSTCYIVAHATCPVHAGNMRQRLELPVNFKSSPRTRNLKFCTRAQVSGANAWSPLRHLCSRCGKAARPCPPISALPQQAMKDDRCTEQPQFQIKQLAWSLVDRRF